MLLRVRDRSELARIPEPNPENWIQSWWDCSVNRLGGPPNPVMRSATNNMPLWDGNPQEKSPACRSKRLCKHTLLIHQAWEQVKWWAVEIYWSRHLLARQHVKLMVCVKHEAEKCCSNPCKAKVTVARWLGLTCGKWQRHRDWRETKTEPFLCDERTLNIEQRKL